jgi:hypothetical protein
MNFKRSQKIICISAASCHGERLHLGEVYTIVAVRGKNLVLKGLNTAYLKSRFASITSEEAILARMGYDVASTKDKPEEVKSIEEYARNRKLCST